MALSPGLGFIPLAWAIFSLLSIIFCYFYAVSVGHVYPFVPSISNTGAKRPEGDIFAEAMNLSSIVCLMIIIIRYFQLKHRAAIHSGRLQRMNLLSLGTGSACMFGVTLIANFPSAEDNNGSTVHDTGAVFTFVTASCYCALQTFLTWKLYCCEIDDHFSWIYRLMLTCIMILVGFLFLMFSLFAYQEFKDSHSNHDILKWEPEDGGYYLHVFSNVCEWMGVGSFILFITSYFKEFQEINITAECSPRSSHDLKSANEFEKLKEDS